MRKNNPREFNRGNSHENRQMHYEKSRDRYFRPDMPDYGLDFGRAHTPSSGFSYSDVDDYETRQFMNPNVEFVPEEPTRDTTGHWTPQYQDQHQSNRNQGLADLIHDVLSKHPDIDVGQIHASTRNGVVILRGHVETRRLKRLIEDVIYGLPGVRDIQNRIEVD